MCIAFIDFRTSFDTVVRGELFKKLEGIGKEGKVPKLIKGIYRNAENEVVIPGK